MIFPRFDSPTARWERVSDAYAPGDRYSPRTASELYGVKVAHLADPRDGLVDDRTVLDHVLDAVSPLLADERRAA